MKTNYFEWKFRQNYLLECLAAILFFFSLQIAAQPGDCLSAGFRPQRCRPERDALLQKYAAEIKAFGEKIEREPKNAELYYQRGRIYSAMMFEKHLGFRTVEFDGRVYFSEIDAKAIADYTQAIKIAPKAAYFEERGNIYRTYWEKEIPWGGEKKTKEEILDLIERIFFQNENFKFAERDFSKTIELSADYETSAAARWKWMNLHQLRAMALGNDLDIAAVIGSGSKADVALADMDYVAEYYKNLYARNKNGWEKDSFYNALVEKGRMARNFGRDRQALEIFSEAEKHWDKTTNNCFVYRFRASIFLQRGELDAALGAVTRALDSGNPRCRQMAEFRGDIYFRRGEWRAAIDDYTAYLNSGDGKFMELFHKRGAAYLKTGEAEKAVADFDYLIEEAVMKSCPQFFRQRAEGYRLTGRIDLAEADEKAADALPQNVKRPLCEIRLLK